MYAHCSMIQILATPIGPKRQPTLLIPGILFPLADTLAVFPRNHSQERDRIFRTFGSLELDAGLRYLPPKENPNLTLEVYHVGFLGMNQAAVTIKSKMLPLVGSLFPVMLSSKKAYLVVHQQMWGTKKQSLNLCLK